MNQNTPADKFDFSQYIILQPHQRRTNGKRIYVVQEDELRINKKSMEAIDLQKTHYVQVGIDKENRIALKLLTEKEYRAAYLGTSGKIKLDNITKELKKRNIKCPACFTVEESPQNDMLVGTYDPTYNFPEPKRTEKRMRTKKKNINKELLPGNE